MDLQFADLVTVALLVLLEGLLSADNALVMPSSCAARIESVPIQINTATASRKLRP